MVAGFVSWLAAHAEDWTVLPRWNGEFAGGSLGGKFRQRRNLACGNTFVAITPIGIAFGGIADRTGPGRGQQELAGTLAPADSAA